MLMNSGKLSIVKSGIEFTYCFIDEGDSNQQKAQEWMSRLEDITGSIAKRIFDPCPAEKRAALQDLHANIIELNEASDTKIESRRHSPALTVQSPGGEKLKISFDRSGERVHINLKKFLDPNVPKGVQGLAWLTPPVTAFFYKDAFEALRSNAKQASIPTLRPGQ